MSVLLFFQLGNLMRDVESQNWKVGWLIREFDCLHLCNPNLLVRLSRTRADVG
jgi:hypothetical protein